MFWGSEIPKYGPINVHFGRAIWRQHIRPAKLASGYLTVPAFLSVIIHFLLYEYSVLRVVFSGWLYDILSVRPSVTLVIVQDIETYFAAYDRAMFL